jgi:plastocyanin
MFGTLLGFALAACLAAAGCGSPVSPSPTAQLAAALTIAAGGDADVYHYDPSSLTVEANTPVEVRFADRDIVDHTWTVFDSDGSTILANLTVAKEGDVATGTFTFSKPGTYSFWCTLPGHKDFGEQGTLVVTP